MTIPEQLIAIAAEVALLETREDRQHQRMLDDQATISQLRAALKEACEMAHGYLTAGERWDPQDEDRIAACRALVGK